MSKIFLLMAFLSSLLSFSQEKLFQVYNDSAALVQDANKMIEDFINQVNSIKPVFHSRTTATLNTKPYLILYSPKSNQVNLPIWHQVIAKQKEFFYELGGNQENGKYMFGLFFNGFFLPHEIGHSLQKAADNRELDLYQNEYFANIVAILYWRSQQRTFELEQCYRFAKKMVTQLPNPVPAGEDPIKYFNEHYSELGSDPYKYGYYQFAQIVKIYEDQSLPNFTTYISNYLKN